MGSSINLPTLQGPLLRSHFLGQNLISQRPHKPFLATPKQRSSFDLKPCAKFDLLEILGGRGLCGGEKGIELELKRNTSEQASQLGGKKEEYSAGTAGEAVATVPENAFEEELMGLTGGFPGGEKGLKQFIEKNPPPKKPVAADSSNTVVLNTTKKPKPPELPLLMPGMFAIVKNPNHPFYMYCGIVQRITGGTAGVLFEGGNWDRLITFRLDELERREKGPPGKNPKSAILEVMLENKDSQ
ncbi:NAD(P)H-quinone oxidoreductase subunit S, chloroplastic isoform X2 [Mangifera indica]|uniref:NAD(P)H-quinone oxidoreductase subunit S, chloroplastic isoform X2 n=1 Tax=Mangifera indica TaxID=29780 RepID=UPI001CFB5754|nr:NAD(P)H-quinone oxidoreductase subunit S, chloroplastic isoform X2 [Mangifera indica]